MMADAMLTAAQKRRRRPTLAERDGQAQLDGATWECLRGATSLGHKLIHDGNCTGRASTVDHIDANRANNALGNLRLVCPRCNAKHRENMKAARELSGENHRDGRGEMFTLVLKLTQIGRPPL